MIRADLKTRIQNFNFNERINRLIVIVSVAIISLFVFTFSTVKVKASEPVKSEMYIGDYEFSKDSTGYSEVKYVESASGKIVKERKAGETSFKKRYYYTDHQGSSVTVLNETGVKISEQTSVKLRYFPYGEQITAEDITKLPVDDTYTGQKRDSESDLMFYNARLYDPSSGVFLQADSVADGFNKYSYVSGNPINAIDPTGHVEVPPFLQKKLDSIIYKARSLNTTIYPYGFDFKQKIEVPKSLSTNLKWGVFKALVTFNVAKEIVVRSKGENFDNTLSARDGLEIITKAVNRSLTYNQDIDMEQEYNTKAKKELERMADYTKGFSMTSFENSRELANKYGQKGWDEYDSDPNILTRIYKKRTVCFDYAVILAKILDENGVKNYKLVGNLKMTHSYLAYENLILDPTRGVVYTKEEHMKKFNYTEKDILTQDLDF